MLQLQRKQKTKDGQEVKHQDHFCCTITCGYCGKRRHYEDECRIKRRESQKLKKAEEEWRNNAGNGGGGSTSGGTPGGGTPGGGQANSAPPTGEKPGPTLKGEQPGEKRTVPSTPSAVDADKANENAKKRRLN